MYGFTKNFTLAIFSSILIGTLAFSYFATKKNQQQPTIEDFNEQQFCAHDYLLQNALATDVATKAKLEQEEAQLYNYMTSSTNLAESTLADFTLPVVVHIVHQNGQEDIPNSQVEQAIQDLNDGFANTLNTQIEFCLAKTNPEGNPSTGVTRVESALTNVTIESEDLMLKDLDRWDPTKYINIWVVKSVSSDALIGTLRGYSYLPAFHGTDRDGVVIEAAFMGSTPENSKVLVHELGHYLGLYHTFYAGCGNDDCLLDGDRVCDTPPDWTVAEAPCEVTENSCYTDVNAADPNNPFASDQNDLRENYMDINPLMCYESFTQGQADRMTFFINGARSSLIGSTVCQNDCANPVEDLSFMPSNDTIIPIGTQLSFVSTSVNATTFNWTLDGTSISTAANLVHLFDEAGTFTLTLTAGNADVDCNITYSIQVTVIDCFGNTHVSDATGVDVFMCGQPGSPCKTIQYALDNVICTGDTIFIHSGTYGLPAATPDTIPVVLIPEDYTVTFFGVEDNGEVIIDGGNMRRGFVYNYSGTNCPPVLPDNGIDISHQINFTHLTIQNTESLEEICVDGTSSAAGSALYLVNALESTLDITIDDCKFLNNISIDDDANNDERTASGAIFFNGRVDDNSSANTNSSISITNSEFSNNRAEQDANGGTGGALALFLVAEINISDSYFCNNSVFTSGGDAGDFDLNRNAGGAIVIYDQTNSSPPDNHHHTIDNCYFFDNSATSTNGGSFLNNSEGGAIFLGRGSSNQTATSTATLNITNSHFYNNTIETGVEHFDNTVGTIIQSGNILENNPFTFSLGNDTTICNIDSITIGTSILGSNYAWNTGATTPMITVSDTGMYILNISMGACEYVDTIVISEMICGEICGNGIDDDGDGLIDCFDPECCGQLACDEHYYNECANSCEFSNSDSNVQAELKWQSNTEVSIASTPITGDIDGDGIPEIIIPTQSISSSNLSIIDGKTGNLKFEIALPFNGDENGNLAIADVDNDGTAEIFNYRGATIYRYEHDGTLSASMTTLGSAVG
ncbi:MAG TPA: hypothetical protein ENJ53_10770, partial [Phaeodactylibacter sp.]|nr:hypothetical protein [Phaeodactylibacter sp.]